MKQKYCKPALIMERFTLTQSIASGCAGVEGGSAFSGYGPTQWNATTCTWEWGGETYFGAYPCTKIITEGAVVDIYCYNNPDGSFLLFGS